ncbi:hypothetical protein GUITHDRAFT_162579, partial [Guillardia theta CCMP2712]
MKSVKMQGSSRIVRVAMIAAISIMIMPDGATASSIMAKEISVSGTGVKEQIKFSPSFAVLKVSLDEDSSIKAEAGAMMSMKNVRAQTGLAGPRNYLTGQVGCLPSVGRALFGEQSLFVNTFTGEGENSWVYLAPRVPGDIFVHTIAPDRELFIQKGSFLGCWMNVETDAKFKGLKGILSGEGMFFLRAYTTDNRSGKVYLSSFGAIERYDVQVGEEITVDTGHIVAFEDCLTYSIGRLSGG